MIPETISTNFFLREKFRFSLLNELLTKNVLPSAKVVMGMRRQRIVEQTTSNRILPISATA